jgi:hypothetical protein
MSQNPAPLSYAQPPQQATAREGFLLRFCAALIDVVFCLDRRRRCDTHFPGLLRS